MVIFSDEELLQLEARFSPGESTGYLGRYKFRKECFDALPVHIRLVVKNRLVVFAGSKQVNPSDDWLFANVESFISLRDNWEFKKRDIRNDELYVSRLGIEMPVEALLSYRAIEKIICLLQGMVIEDQYCGARVYFIDHYLIWKHSIDTMPMQMKDQLWILIMTILDPAVDPRGQQARFNSFVDFAVTYDNWQIAYDNWQIMHEGEDPDDGYLLSFAKIDDLIEQLALDLCDGKNVTSKLDLFKIYLPNKAFLDELPKSERDSWRDRMLEELSHDVISDKFLGEFEEFVSIGTSK